MALVNFYSVFLIYEVVQFFVAFNFFVSWMTHNCASCFTTVEKGSVQIIRVGMRYYLLHLFRKLCMIVLKLLITLQGAELLQFGSVCKYLKVFFWLFSLNGWMVE